MSAQPRNLLAATEAWRVLSASPFDRHGPTEVRPGHLAMASGQPATGLGYRGPVPRIDYRVEIEARRTEGSDFFCGLAFPILDQYASLIIGGWGGGVTGISNIDDMAAVENETTGYTPFENNRWYNIELRVTRLHLSASIDGAQIVSVDVPDRRFSVWVEQEPLLPLGVSTWYSAGEVRKMQLEEIRPPEGE